MTLFVLLACGAPEAEFGSTVVLTGGAVVPLSDSVLEPDGEGEIFPVEVAVFDPDELPAVGVRVLLTVGWDGAALYPNDDSLPATHWVRIGRTDAEVGLPACSANDLDAGCTFLELQTDGTGIARALLFVDVLPDSGANIPVFGSAGGDVTSIEMEFAEVSVVQ